MPKIFVRGVKMKMHVLNHVTIGHKTPCLCAGFFRMIRNFNWRYLENNRTDFNAVYKLIQNLNTRIDYKNVNICIYTLNYQSKVVASIHAIFDFTFSLQFRVKDIAKNDWMAIESERSRFEGLFPLRSENELSFLNQKQNTSWALLLAKIGAHIRNTEKVMQDPYSH